jgi:hypothetical protein
VVDSVVDRMAGHYPCGGSRQCIDGVDSVLIVSQGQCCWRERPGPCVAEGGSTV